MNKEDAQAFLKGMGIEDQHLAAALLSLNQAVYYSNNSRAYKLTWVKLRNVIAHCNAAQEYFTEEYIEKMREVAQKLGQTEEEIEEMYGKPN